jgi:hypothetical protein
MTPGKGLDDTFSNGARSTNDDYFHHVSPHRFMFLP